MGGHHNFQDVCGHPVQVAMHSSGCVQPVYFMLNC